MWPFKSTDKKVDELVDAIKSVAIEWPEKEPEIFWGNYEIRSHCTECGWAEKRVSITLCCPACGNMKLQKHPIRWKIKVGFAQLCYIGEPEIRIDKKPNSIKKDILK